MSVSNVTVKTLRDSFGTTYWITGAEEDVKAWCDRLKESYHPCGYGTSCRLYKANEDSTVTYRAHRYNSCD